MYVRLHLGTRVGFGVEHTKDDVFGVEHTKDDVLKLVRY